MRLTGAASALSLLIISSPAAVDGFATRSFFVGGNARVRTSSSFTSTAPPLLGDDASTFSAISPAVAGGSGADGDVTTNKNASSSAGLSAKDQKKKERMEKIRKEGGIFAFNTKYGALNPFGIYYGLMAILLGIPWYIGLTACQLLYFVTRNKVDKFRRFPTFLSHVWGVTLMHLTRNYPKMENYDILRNFYKEKRPAMFVANHASWMDIPFLGATIGWRDYKLVSKKELGRVPILGKAIKIGGHVMLDRSDHRSQIRTLKRGIQTLKDDGIHLCAFPEGTRSRTGKLMKFKNGAFKMAYKAGAPVIPISIVNAAEVMPPYWMFPFKPARNVAKVVIHEPIETKGKSEKEVAKEVRKAMISGLPPNQRPDGE